MTERTLTVINKLGIHARPAGRIVDITSSCNSKIEMIYEGQRVDGKSILNIMMLAIEPEAKVIFIADGKDEVQVLDKLENLFNNSFYEDAS